MKIDIQTRQLSLSRNVCHYAEQKVRNVFTRFDERINKVSLWLSDVNGSKGGLDKNCQIHILMSGKPDVVIKETRGTLHLAINRAMDRAAQAVVRKLDRQRSRRKQSAGMLPVLSEPV